MQGAAVLYNNFMKDFLADSNAARIPTDKVEVTRILNAFVTVLLAIGVAS